MTALDQLEISIATTTSAVAKGWKRTEVLSWSQLVARLMEHDVRDEKDGPLWAPVVVADKNRRTNDSVVAMTCMVLDYDCGVDIDEALVPIVEMGLACVAHSSHRHSPEHPKFRLVLPFSRPVAASEWPEAWEILHAILGPLSDVSCKNSARIYYLPSCPPGAAFDAIVHELPGNPIDVDGWLREQIEGMRLGKQAMQPLEQAAAAGRREVTGRGDYSTLDVFAWAQARGLKPRLEEGGEGKTFIECPWKSEHTDGKQGPKDTYLLNKRDGGKPVFKCSHSHCSKRGFWDIRDAVGDADRFCECDLEEPSRIRPSQRFDAEPDFEGDTGRADAIADAKSQAALVADIEGLAEQIDSLVAAGIEWAIVDGHGRPKCGVANAIAFLRKEFEGKSVRMNEFTRLIEVNGEPVQEAMIARLLERIELLSGQTKWSRSHMDNAFLVLAAQAPKYHPIREWLESLQWDGVPRLSGLAGAIGAEARPLYGRYLECFFLGAVARVMDPGCKVDTALILQGPQGSRKSTFFQSLVPVESWFSDDMGGLDSKDSSMAVGRAWIIEWAELESVRRSATGSVKAFLTRRVDRFRPPYGRELIDVPRSSVIVGTTNDDQFLQDSTGNRRYMVIPAGMIDIETILRDRDQIWAEAYVRHGYQEAWHLSPEEMKEQSEQNADLISEDPWKPLVDRWLQRSASFTTTGYTATLQEVLRSCLEIPTERQGRAQQMRVAQILGDLGWRRTKVTIDGRRTWVYQSPPAFRQSDPIRFSDGF